MGADEADDGIERADDARATGDGGLVDERHDVLTAGGLVLGGTAKVATGTHAGADGTDGNPGTGSSGLQEPRVGMRRIFDRDLDGVEAPVLELLEEMDALVGERRGVEERIEAETHGGVGEVGRVGVLEGVRGRSRLGVDPRPFKGPVHPE